MGRGSTFRDGCRHARVWGPSLRPFFDIIAAPVGRLGA